MKRAPFIYMKKRPFEQTFGAEAKENNVPGQKKSSLTSMHNSILSVERFSADGGTDTKSAAVHGTNPGWCHGAGLKGSDTTSDW